MIPSVTLGMLPLNEHAMAIGDSVILYDNLDTDKEPAETDIPIKLMMAFGILCFAGKINVRLNQKDYELTRNSCLICMPGTIIEHLRITPDCKVITGMVSQKHFSKIVMHSTDVIHKWIMYNNGHMILNYSDKIGEAFMQSYKLFKSLFCNLTGKYAQDAAIGFFYFSSAIFASCSDEEKTEAPKDTGNNVRKKELLMKFLNDVHKHCIEERSVAFYAGQCCLSPKYFARIITEMTGEKPGDIIKTNVILEAKVMLASNELTVQQVSDRLHFPNASFFCKYFKSATGCSPKQYQIFGEKAVKKEV